MSVHKATLRLFKALPVINKKLLYVWDSPETVKTTIPRGYVFSPEVCYNYPGGKLNEAMSMIEANYGMTAEGMNATFHKSWQKIVDTPQEELIIQALAHYATTYGKEQPLEYLLEKEIQWQVDNLGQAVFVLPNFDANKLFDEDYIYLPDELLEIPDVGDIKLVIIKGLTKAELKVKLMALLQSGIALDAETADACYEVALFVDIEAHEVVQIKNKEVKTMLMDEYDLVPTDPVEFLRYVVYKATGTSLLIKNKGLIEKIKGNTLEKSEDLVSLFSRYKRTVVDGDKVLASIFYRFKPIFLAFKTTNKLRPVINKLRRLAKKYHKPMKPDFLNNVTANLKKWGCDGVDYSELQSWLNKANCFRKIRLAYALKYRTTDVDSILYRIRNGKSYAKEFSFPCKEDAGMVLDAVMASIVENIAPNVRGKRIYIPDYIHYTLPATEKMFTGNFPTGTSVNVPDHMVFGINWKNLPEHRVDLDLSFVDNEGKKIGWDSMYSSEDKGVLFSGDITDARGKNGATELFYIGRPRPLTGLMYVNYYNHEDNNHEDNYPVPFKIVVARQNATTGWGENYVIDPNNMVALSNSNIAVKQKILGLVVSTAKENRFYFTETSLGNKISVSSGSVYGNQARKYLFNYYGDSIDLVDVLEKAGAEIYTDKNEEMAKIDIDLSPEALEKDTIIKLLT